MFQQLLLSVIITMHGYKGEKNYMTENVSHSFDDGDCFYF